MPPRVVPSSTRVILFPFRHVYKADRSFQSGRLSVIASRELMGDRYPIDVVRGKLQDNGPTASQVVTVAAMFPLGGLLLTLSGLALAGSVVGLVVLAPLFLLFSPVLVPAALVLALAVTGFLASGALGCTGVSSLAYTMRQARAALQQGPKQVDYAKRRVAETAGHLGQKTREAGHAV
ncbi:oleosin 18 kDa-like [Zingiber officinale]|uniref:Oleosin n=1 Tax=Zingiber officinale TaxID=94328 RepID=A0A8J5C3J2_ZINOF|nr:oleosin 18 kDa-like [Zingiber officinale]KAG6471763.1 hypothetical protein ZIOFF_069209 [Zingiber officinale]